MYLQYRQALDKWEMDKDFFVGTYCVVEVMLAGSGLMYFLVAG